MTLDIRDNSFLVGETGPALAVDAKGQVVIPPAPTRSALLKGVREHRGISEFELRDAGNGVLTFTGYAAVWDNPYDVNDMFGTFTESVERGALKRTLSRNPNVVLNVNHAGLPLARTSAGTLRIGTDAHGYLVEADLEPRDPDVNGIRYKLERGDLTDMSWAFRVTVDEWSIDDDGHESRVIKEVNVDGGDVSIVTNGANPTTEAHIRALAEIDAALTARGDDIDPELVQRAIDNLSRYQGETPEPASEPRKTLGLKAAKRTLLLEN